MGEQALVAALAAAEAPHRAAIEAAIDAWPDAPDPWGRLAGPALWFLDLRFRSCSEFVLSFCLAGDHPESAFVEFPAGWDRAGMARYLLTRWWEAHGRRAAAVALIVEAHETRLGIE